jgi:23S rRNA pseudouridine1911/1915/1917 synthase
MGSVELSSPKQAEQAHLDKIVDGFWATASVVESNGRDQSAVLGHPLVADELYGGEAAAGLTRQALHARRLAFAHPCSAEALAFVAPVPDDLEHAIQALGLSYNGKS